MKETISRIKITPNYWNM